MLNFNPLLWPYPLEPEIIVSNVVFEGEPIAKQRARISRYGGFYTPNLTKDYQSAIALLIKNSLKSKEIDSINKFGLRTIFYRSNRQRIDCDNLIKSISDAATGIIWKDDCQVQEIFGKVFLKNKKPRAEILIYKLEDPSPKPRCPICSNEMRSFDNSIRKFCSRECYQNAHNSSKECKECKKSFNRQLSISKKMLFCSLVCAMRNITKKRITGKESFRWKCTICGDQVSRKEYKRCWKCMVKNPRFEIKVEQ